MKTLDQPTLKKMVQGIAGTQDHEIDCDECFDELDRFADAVLLGKNIDEALALVKDHLDRCTFCREEYEALMAALRVVE